MANLTDTDGTTSPTAAADREAIRDLANLYAHHVWQRDIPALVGLFAADGGFETAALPPIRGREALVEAFGRMFEEDEFHPFVHGHIVELDGDAATGTVYIDLRAKMHGELLSGWGFYEDRYVRVDGAWKFANRRINMLRYVKLGPELTENPQRTWED